MVNPYDRNHPWYQDELGYIPCRDEECEIEECHARHLEARRGRPVIASAARAVVRAEVIKQQRLKRLQELGDAGNRTQTDRAVQREREATGYYQAKEKLEELGVFPRAIHETQDGHVLAIEWTCPQCDGKGWQQNPGAACRFCLGHGTTPLTYEERLVLTQQRSTQPRSPRGIVKRQLEAQAGQDGMVEARKNR